MGDLTIEPESGATSARKDFQQGRIAFQGDDLEMALRHFQAALDLEPAHLNAKLYLGRIFVRLKDDEKAERIFRDVIETQARNDAAHFMLGRLLMRRRDRAGALAHLEIAAAERPDDDQILLLVAQLLSEMARPADAAAIYRTVLERSPENHGARKSLAELQWKSGNRAESLLLLQQTTHAAPDDPTLQLSLARKCLVLNKFPEAVSAFKLVISGDPENIEAIIGLGRCALLTFDVHGAAAYFQSAAALAPNDLSVRKWVSRTDDIQGRLQSSAPARAESVDDTWRAKLIEAAALLRDPETDRKKREKAVSLLVSHGFTDLTPGNSSVLDRLARELDRMGLSQSVDALQRPSNPDSDELNSLAGCVERLNFGAETLVLVFAGINQDVFFSFDLFHRFLGGADLSIVYLRNTLYNGFTSIDGLADDFSGMVDKFREIMTRAGARRLLIIGYCLGVMGAVNFARALRAEAVLCIKPFLTMPNVDQMPPPIAARAAALLEANPQYQGYMPEFEFDAEGAPPVTMIVHADFEAGARIARDLARKSDNIKLVMMRGGGTSDCFVDAAARGLLWPLLSSFVADGAAAADVLAALEQGG